MKSVPRTRLLAPIAIACALVALLAFVGCSGKASTDDASKQQDTSQQQGTAIEKVESDAKEVADAAHFDARLTELAGEVDTAIATAGAAVVPDTAAERPGAYFDAAAPLKDLSHKLDLLDDEVEAAYRAGTLTHDETWRLEREIDRLDDLIDSAEDALELRMGVDD